ncbi:MAG: class I SAM-dependent methyltransferase [Gammaproteobacteria bacterium]|nr:MAG: class I SAM-dependent methyltransferase [Gammaproteobacteria bacterium]
MDFNRYKNSYCETIEESLKFAGQEHDFYTRVKAESIRHLIKKHLPHIDMPYLLDIGCGHGLIHKHLKDHNLRLVGVEMADEVLQLAKQNNPDITYLCHDGKILPFKENTFDAVIAICVMHHIPPQQWADFLTEMKRIIKPDGIAIIFEHNPYNPFTRYIVKNNILDKDAVLLSSRKLKTLLARAGFSHTKSRNILFTPFSHFFFRWLDKILGWCPFGAQYYAKTTKK